MPSELYSFLGLNSRNHRSQYIFAENEKWFRNFSFGELWETTFGWKPEIPPSNQALLEEYGEEEDDE